MEAYRLDEAEVAIVVMGSAAGTAKGVVDALRQEGVKAGLLKVRAFRPFPARALAAAVAPLQAVAVLDRADSFGSPGGPLFTDVRAALQAAGRPVVVNYIYGLGGRDLLPGEIRRVYGRLGALATGVDREGGWCEYLTLREGVPVAAESEPGTGGQR